jgi:DNA-binding transcriptional regulator YiaG
MGDNMLDAYAKGRKAQPRSQHVNAKLTAAQVREIRQRYGSGGVKQTQLAAEFGVSQRVISLVTRHESYMDI